MHSSIVVTHSRSRQTTCGAALIELSLIISLLVVLAAGLVEAALALHNVYTLKGAVREGARQASLTPDLTVNDARISTFVTSNTDILGSTSALTITNTVPTVKDSIQNANSSDCSYEVTVTAQTTHFFAIWKVVRWGSLNIEAESSMRYAYQPLCN